MRRSQLLQIPAVAARRLERTIARVSLRPIRAAMIVGVLSFAVNLGIASLAGIPEPHVHDEFSYLLAADTLPRPAHQPSAHLFGPLREYAHSPESHLYLEVSTRPGAGLAAGKIIGGHFIVGAWLAVASACAAVCWMLMAWVRPRLALLGGLLAALHPMVVLWGQNYFGGGLQLLGWLLLLGGMRRAVDRPRLTLRPRDGTGHGHPGDHPSL